MSETHTAGMDPRLRVRRLRLPWPGTPGLEVHVEEAGEGSTGFLLLHGFTFNSSSWHDVLGGLADLGRVVAYDRIPFGRSAKLQAGDWTGPNPYAPDATLEQLFALMDAVGLARAVLVGNSAGGLLAARAALDRPDRVAGLVLSCPAIFTGPGGRGAGLLRIPWLGIPLARRLGDNAWVLRRSFHDPARITDDRLARTRIATTQPGWDRALWEFLKASTMQPDISGHLDQLRQPVLILGTTHDRVVKPADFPRLKSRLPDGELVLVPDAGHVPHEEQPAACLAAIRDWLGRRPGLGALLAAG